MKRASTLLVSLLAANYFAAAQSTAPGNAAPAPRAEARPAATSLSAIAKDLKKIDGYFPFYYDEKTGKIYLEIEKFDQSESQNLNTTRPIHACLSMERLTSNALVERTLLRLLKVDLG